MSCAFSPGGRGPASTRGRNPALAAPAWGMLHLPGAAPHAETLPGTPPLCLCPAPCALLPSLDFAFVSIPAPTWLAESRAGPQPAAQTGQHGAAWDFSARPSLPCQGSAALLNARAGPRGGYEEPGEPGDALSARLQQREGFGQGEAEERGEIPCPPCACPHGAAQQLAADPECSWGLPGGFLPDTQLLTPPGLCLRGQFGRTEGGKAAKLPRAGRALGGLRPSERVAICVFLNKWRRKRRWFWTDSSPAGAVTTCGLALWFGTRTHQPGTGILGG